MKRSNSLYSYRELEDILANEVKKKQELVAGLSKEKHSLTKRLKAILKEIKQDKSKLRGTMKLETMVGDPLLDPLLKSEEKTLTKANSVSSSRNLHTATSISEEDIKELEHDTPKESELEIGQVFDRHEQRVAVLKKDKKLYEIQYKKLLQKVNFLKNQLSESLQEASQCI